MAYLNNPLSEDETPHFFYSGCFFCSRFLCAKENGEKNNFHPFWTSRPYGF